MLVEIFLFAECAAEYGQQRGGMEQLFHGGVSLQTDRDKNIS